jgi:hypothetical protein
MSNNNEAIAQNEAGVYIVLGGAMMLIAVGAIALAGIVHSLQSDTPSSAVQAKPAMTVEKTALRP